MRSNLINRTVKSNIQFFYTHENYFFFLLKRIEDAVKKWLDINDNTLTIDFKLLYFLKQWLLIHLCEYLEYKIKLLLLYVF